MSKKTFRSVHGRGRSTVSEIQEFFNDHEKLMAWALPYRGSVDSAMLCMTFEILCCFGAAP